MPPRFVPVIIQVFDKNGAATVKQMTDAFKQLDQTAERTSNQGLQNVFVKADLISRGIAQLTQQVIAGAREFLEYDRQLANLNTLLSDDRSLQTFRSGLLNLDPALGKTSELARGMYQAISSGVDEADALDFIAHSAKAARAGLASTFETVDAGTSVMASFGIKGSEVTIVYDKMFETVKRGKVEMPQLAQSIGQVTNIAAQAGVTLDEMFAVIATGSRTVRPQMFIEGFRTALANILKPSEQALEVARRLNVEFGAEALKDKGFARFITDVTTAAKGNKEDLARLFGDIQALNAIMAITGNQAKTFAEDLKGIASASGTVEEAFQKQKQALGSQLEELQTTVFQGLAKALLVIEPLLSKVLRLVNDYPGVFAAAIVVISGLTLATTLYNTQLAFTAATQIPAFIAGVKSVIFWMINWRVAITDTQVAMTVLTGYMGLFAVAIGVLVYAIATYESAAEKANKITLEQIDAQVKASEQAEALATAARDVASAQLDSGDKHSRLNDILAQLDPATAAYVKALRDEESQLKAVNSELEKQAALKRSVLEAELVVIGSGIGDQLAELKDLDQLTKSLNDRINANEKLIAEGGGIFGKNFRAGEIRAFSQDLVNANGSIDTLNKALGENEKKLIKLALALDLDRSELEEFFRSAGFAKERIVDLTNIYDRLTTAQRENASATRETTEAVDRQTDALKRLQAIQQAMSARRERIDAATLEIIENAKNAAEARRQLNELRRNNEEFRKDLDDQRRVQENKRAIDSMINPSQGGGGSNDRLISSLVKINLGLGPVIPKDPKLAEMIRSYAATFGIPLWVAFAQLYTESVGYKESVISGRQLSPQGAIGLAQVMPGTAQQYGFSVQSLKTPEGALTAWAKIMTDLFRRYGDWQLAILAYHQGPGTVDKLKAMLDRRARGEITDNQAEAAYQRIIGPKGRAYIGTISAYQQSASQAQTASLPDLPGEVRLLIDELRKKQQGQLTTISTIADSVDRLLTDDEKYVANLLRALDYEVQLGNATLRRRTIESEAAADSKRQMIELENVELDLQKTRQQQVDQGFLGQRRKLFAMQEEVDLLLSIGRVQDEIATGPYNQSLRIQLALLQDIADIRRRDEEAIKAQNRAQLELAEGDVFRPEQARARVLEHLSQVRSETEIFADAIIESYEQVNEAVYRGIQRVTGGIQILDSFLAGIASRLTNKLFQKLLDVLIPGSGGTVNAPRATSSAGGGNIFQQIFGGLFGGGSSSGAAAATTAGGLSFGSGAGAALFGGGGITNPQQAQAAALARVFGGGLTTPVSLTTQLAQQQALSTALGGGQVAAAGASTATVSLFSKMGLAKTLGPLAPIAGALLGYKLGGSSRTGSILGAIGGGLAGLGILGGLSAATLGGVGGSFGASIATGVGGLFGTTGGLGGMFAGLFGGSGSLASFAAIAGPIALIAAPLLIGAIILSRNAARRRDEKTRNQAMLDALAQLNAIRDAVKRNGMDGPSAITSALQIREQYVTAMTALKDSKTRRIALADVSRLDAVIAQIRGAADVQTRRREVENRIVPEFNTGAIFKSDYFIPKAARGLMSIPGQFDRRDDILMRVSRGEHVAVMTPDQYDRIGGSAAFAAAGVPAFASGVDISPHATQFSGARLSKPKLRAMPVPTVQSMSSSSAEGNQADGDIHLHFDTLKVDAEGIVFEGMKGPRNRRVVFHISRTEKG